MKKRVLIANSYYIADTGGGATAVLLELGNFFYGKGYDVDILTGKIYKEKIGNFKKFNLTEVGINEKGFLPLRHFLFLIKYLTVKLGNYEQVWVNDFPSSILALRFKNVNFICFAPNGLLYMRTNYYLDKTQPYIRPFLKIYVSLMRKFDKFLNKRIGKIVVISKSSKDKVKDYYGRDDSIVAYPGVYFEEHKNIEFQKFIYVASRFVPPKRVDIIVKAMKYLPDYEMRVTGFGEEEEKLRQIVKDENLNVKFLGFVSVKERDELYAKCLCSVYIPENEDYGLVPLEAQSYGKMTIGAKEGALLETIVDGKTGFLIENPTPEKIAKAVRKIEKLDLKKHAKFCIENAKKFSWENFHKKFEEFVSH